MTKDTTKLTTRTKILLNWKEKKESKKRKKKNSTFSNGTADVKTFSRWPCFSNRNE